MRTNQQPTGLRLPTSIIDDAEIEQQLRNAAWQQIVCGDDNVDEYVEWMTDEDESVTTDQAAAAFAYVRTARVTQQVSWTDEPTNLTRAFDALAEIGILARQNFSCCGTCAAAEIWDELDDTRTWRGYIYFHMLLQAEGIGWEWTGDFGTRILLTNAEYFARLG